MRFKHGGLAYFPLLYNIFAFLKPLMERAAKDRARPLRRKGGLTPFPLPSPPSTPCQTLPSLLPFNPPLYHCFIAPRASLCLSKPSALAPGGEGARAGAETCINTHCFEGMSATHPAQETNLPAAGPRGAHGCSIPICPLRRPLYESHLAYLFLLESQFSPPPTPHPTLSSPLWDLPLESVLHACRETRRDEA